MDKQMFHQIYGVPPAEDKEEIIYPTCVWCGDQVVEDCVEQFEYSYHRECLVAEEEMETELGGGN